MADTVDINVIDSLWEDVLARDGNPAPEVTIGGGSGTLWLDADAALDSLPPAETAEPSTGVDNTSFNFGSSLTIRTSRIGKMHEDDHEDFAETVGEDFVILDEIGRGGMGVVYNARQGSLNRNVAVKMIAPFALANQGARRKMVAEALVTGDLDHPNIIPIYDLGRTERNELFYAMKIVQGIPWSRRIAGGSLRDNLAILLRVADAVAFAHAKGILHRDLKPGNVMLGEYGEVLLMDWGLAVSLEPSAKAEQLNPVNAMAGTPAYMAPEMAQGLLEKIGTSSDIYLLGAVLFEIVTGGRPHSGATARDCLRAAANNEIIPANRTDVLLEVARKAMSTDPGDRYASVKEFQNAVNTVEIHRESLSLTASAEEYLADAEKRGDYSSFARSVFAFREAAKLWPENARADIGEKTARKRYAACAFAKSDYDLSLDNLEGFVDAESDALREKIRRAREESRQRRRRLRFLTFAAIGLTAAVVVILATATVIVTDRMNREREARDVARRALVETNEARERERAAATDRQEALEREKEALLREREAQDARLAALDQAEAERRRKEEAERARLALADEMSRKGQLEDASWWAFSPGEAVERQRAAAAEMGVPVRVEVRLGGEAVSMVLIPAGEFVMGSSPRSDWHAPDEYLHRVVLSGAFYLGVGEVTRSQWRAAVGMERVGDLMPEYNPAVRDEGVEEFERHQLEIWGWRVREFSLEEGRLPATGVSVREIEGLFLPAVAGGVPVGWSAVLPSEAEWEYGARSGSSGPYFGHVFGEGLEVPGWTRENSGQRLHGGGEFGGNAWGLVDMHGNAGEIVRDGYSADYYLVSPLGDPVNVQAVPFRVYRGGNIMHSASGSLSASRHRIHLDNRYAQIGFRLALER